MVTQVNKFLTMNELRLMRIYTALCACKAS